jgi:hypothetical protein
LKFPQIIEKKEPVHKVERICTKIINMDKRLYDLVNTTDKRDTKELKYLTWLDS